MPHKKGTKSPKKKLTDPKTYYQTAYETPLTGRVLRSHSARKLLENAPGKNKNWLKLNSKSLLKSLSNLISPPKTVENYPDSPTDSSIITSPLTPPPHQSQTRTRKQTPTSSIRQPVASPHQPQKLIKL